MEFIDCKNWCYIEEDTLIAAEKWSSLNVQTILLKVDQWRINWIQLLWVMMLKWSFSKLEQGSNESQMKL